MPSSLVWRFRSPHHSRGESKMRTSEPKPHWIDKLPVSLDSEVRKRACRHDDANFGIGTLVAGAGAGLLKFPSRDPTPGHAPVSARDPIGECRRALFRATAKFHGLHKVAIAQQKEWYHEGKGAHSEAKFMRILLPKSWLFSGWNCEPIKFPERIMEEKGIP